MYLFVYVLICLRTYKYLYVLIPLYIPELPTTDFCRYEWKSFGTIFRAQLRRNCLHFVTYHCEISNVVFCCCCSVTKLCPALCNPMDCSMPGFPVLRYLPDFAQIHVHWAGNATQTISSENEEIITRGEPQKPKNSYSIMPLIWK